MAKVQTRRSISLSLDYYLWLSDQSEDSDRSMASIVEGLIATRGQRAGIDPPDQARVDRERELMIRRKRKRDQERAEASERQRREVFG